MDRRTVLSQLTATACAVLLFARVGAAQQEQPRHPAPDSYELYVSFFFFNEDFAKWTAARMAADPSRKAQVLTVSAKYLGILPADMSIVDKITSETVARLRAVGEEAKTVVESQKAKGNVDHGALFGFHNRRRGIIQSAVSELKRSLSQQSWHGLSNYVNNEHRQHVTMSPSAKRPVH